nr:MAG TPA_asm: hypothetical protein [Caudoviricetes sp.]
MAGRFSTPAGKTVIRRPPRSKRGTGAAGE